MHDSSSSAFLTNPSAFTLYWQILWNGQTLGITAWRAPVFGVVAAPFQVVMVQCDKALVLFPSPHDAYKTRMLTTYHSWPLQAMYRIWSHHQKCTQLYSSRALSAVVQLEAREDMPASCPCSFLMSPAYSKAPLFGECTPDGSVVKSCLTSFFIIDHFIGTIDSFQNVPIC